MALSKRSVFLACALLLGGCRWIPGTDENKIAKGEKIAAEMLIDPSSGMFRNSATFDVQDQKGVHRAAVCGEINGKNRNGAYAGYSRFISVVESKQAELEPTLSVSKEEAARLGEQCKREAKGPFYFDTERDLARMTCQQAKDAATEQLQLAQFELDWAAMCGTENGPHLPKLVTTSPDESGSSKR